MHIQRVSGFFGGVAACLPLLYTLAWPQQGMAETASVEGESTGLVEEVVVWGIRNSVREAMSIKREHTNFVDAISAEDVGKLPDSNIAEALQRVTGVAIQRNRGEGDFVSIRGLGPNFVRSTLNGRTMLNATESRSATLSGGVDYSTGREVNFDVLPAEIIRTLEVVKSPSAEHVEGGMGGVVNIRTHRPLSLGTIAAGTVKGTYRAFDKDIDPSGSFLYSWSNDDTFGMLASVSYSKRNIREDNSNSWAYCPPEHWCTTSDIDSDADGTADISGFVMPSSNILESFLEDRERVTVETTAEWLLGDVHAVVVDVLYSERTIDNVGSLAHSDWPPPLGPADAVVNADGSRQFSAEVNSNGTLVRYLADTPITPATDLQNIDDTLLSLGLNYGLTLGEWGIDTDVSYSEAEGYLNFQRSSIKLLGNSSFEADLDGGRINFRPLPDGPDLSDPANYQTNNADSVERYNDDSELALSLDATYRDTLKLGVRYRERSKDVEDRTTFNVNTDKFPVGGSGIGTRRIDNFLDGKVDYPFDQVIFPDLEDQRDYIRSQNPDASFESVYQPSDSYEIDERTLAVYTQLDFARELLSLPATGNVGVRFVRTDTDVTGFFQPFRIENDETSGNLGSIEFLSDEITTDEINSDYTHVLPSLNLRVDLHGDLYLRFSVNKSVNRPTFKQLSPGLGVANPTNRIATAGNPTLVAYDAMNYDLGMEWYFGDSSAVYVGGFLKNIDDFVGIATSVSSATEDSDGDGDGIPDGLGSDVEFFGVGFASVSQPLNQGEAEILGLEAGYQHAFDNGFGYILNVTLAESSAEFTSGAKDGEVIPFEGVSDYSFNLTGFYERNRIQARAAYSYRSEFVLLSSDAFGNTVYVDGYGQLDASLSYDVNDNFTVFLSALNLTNESTDVYSDSTDRPLSLAHVGTRIELGVRASF